MFFIEVVVATDDVRFLNHLNLTSTTQVMVHFPRLPQLRLFICLCLDLGTSFCFEKRGNLEFFFLHISCSYICKLDVRLPNHPN